MTDSYIIRKAEIQDRDELLNLLNIQFPGPANPPMDFMGLTPYLFSDERMDQHFVCDREGELIGCIGVYPYDIQIGSAVFRTAGIGQVITHSKARGLGIMTAILNKVTETLHNERCDFGWLYGDRQRYGRYGWACGGCRKKFSMFDKYLPPPENTDKIRPFQGEKDFELVRHSLDKMHSTVIMPDHDLQLSLARQDIGGLVLGESFILHEKNDEFIILAGGDEADLTNLIVCHCQRRKQKDSDNWKVTIETGPANSALMTLAQKYYWTYQGGISGMFHMGVLQSFMTKAFEVAKPLLAGRDYRFEVVNTDTDEKVCISGQQGEMIVSSDVSSDALRLTTRELSELCFGPCAHEAIVPSLAPDSVARIVFPLPVHIPTFFRV